MEEYLIEDYTVIIEDKKWLKSEDEIKGFFSDFARDDMKCGQGFFTDEIDYICQIGENFYDVHVEAEIGSSKQDRGDRLYWIEKISRVSYKEISMPQLNQKLRLATFLFI